MSAEKKDEWNTKKRERGLINKQRGRPNLCSGAGNVHVEGINSSYAHIQFMNIDSSSLAWLYCVEEGDEKY
jgi:hypothetical protein